MITGNSEIECLTVNGLAVERRGSGPPLVLVHGTNGDVRSFDPLMPFLDGHELWTYSRRGYKPSGAAKAGKSFGDDVDDLVSVINKAGGRAHVLGVSYGGIVALHAAYDRSSVIEPPLILFEPPLFSAGPHMNNVLQRFQFEINAGRLREAAHRFAAEVARLPAPLLALSAPEPSLDELIGCLSDLSALAACSRPIAEWSEISTAIVLMYGTDTWEPMPQTMDELRAALRDVQPRAIEAHSHFATHTAPELFARIVREALYPTASGQANK